MQGLSAAGSRVRRLGVIDVVACVGAVLFAVGRTVCFWWRSAHVEVWGCKGDGVDAECLGVRVVSLLQREMSMEEVRERLRTFRCRTRK